MHIDPHVAHSLVEAISNESETVIIYSDKDSVISARVIRPLAIKRSKNGKPILKAFDGQRDDWRNFRLDRIQKCVR